MFMEPQSLSAKTGVSTELATYTNEAAYNGAWLTAYEIPRMQDDPTIFMKAQQLSAKAGVLTEFQVTQNKQLTKVLVARVQHKKRF